MNSPLLSLLKQLWYYLSKQRRIQFISLFLLMIITSLSEIVSIGSMLPFITVLTNPVLVFHNSHLHSLITVVGITEPTQLMLPLTIVFGVATIISGAMRLLLLGTSTTVSFLATALPTALSKE